MVPNNIKNCNSINKFKNSIKSWKPNECPCILCKIYIAQVGFIWFTSPFCDISEEKKDYVYFVFFEIFYIHFVFVHCSEWRSFAWFPAKGFFFFGGRGGMHRLCRFFGRFAQGSAETVNFQGISSLGNWVKLLYFLQFCIFIYLLLRLSSSSLSLWLLSLFLLLSLLLFWLALIRHISFCWCELL